MKLPWILAALAAAWPARGDEPAPVVVAALDGDLDEASVALVRRAVRVVRDEAAAALLLEVNVDSDDVERVRRIVAALDECPAPTIALVRQQSAGAGAFLALACRKLFMAPGSVLGPARHRPASPIPIPLPPDLRAIEDETLLAEQKNQLLQLRTAFRARAQEAGRSEAVAEALVDPEAGLYEVSVEGLRDLVGGRRLRELEAMHGKERVLTLRVLCEPGRTLSLTALEAEELGFVDGVAAEPAELLDRLRMAGTPQLVLGASWSERLVAWVDRLAWVLVAVGLLALFVELKLPGFGLPGTLGILCLGLVLFGKYLAGLAEVAELLLIAAGLVLVAVEIFLLPGTILPGVLGMLALLAGLLLAFQSTHLPGELGTAVWWGNVQKLGLTLAASIVGMFLLAHFLPRLPGFRAVRLRSAPAGVRSAAVRDDVHWSFAPAVGALARCVSPLRPAGKIDLEGRRLDAVAEGRFVEEGQVVRVVQVEGNRIVVRPVEGQPP